MLALYVIDPWPNFYAKGMKTWEIRSYPIDYRGELLIVSSHTNKVVCKMILKDCIPLTKELWEMHFDKHRTSCSFEELPYRPKTGTAYAWVLSEPVVYKEDVQVSRADRKPHHLVEDAFVANKPTEPIIFHPERMACKFPGNTMLIYWLKKKYFALVCISDLESAKTKLLTEEISESDVPYIINHLDVKTI